MAGSFGQQLERILRRGMVDAQAEQPRDHLVAEPVGDLEPGRPRAPRELARGRVEADAVDELRVEHRHRRRLRAVRDLRRCAGGTVAGAAIVVVVAGTVVAAGTVAVGSVAVAVVVTVVVCVGSVVVVVVTGGGATGGDRAGGARSRCRSKTRFASAWFVSFASGWNVAGDFVPISPAPVTTPDLQAAPTSRARRAEAAALPAGSSASESGNDPYS